MDNIFGIIGLVVIAVVAYVSYRIMWDKGEQ
jgi:hypothetical protein